MYQKYTEAELRKANTGRTPETTYTAAWRVDPMKGGRVQLRKIGDGISASYEISQGRKTHVYCRSWGEVRLWFLRSGYTGTLPAEIEYATRVL